jgi:hypothetical protein
MPAAVFHNDTALSFAYAINNAQDTFTINRDDAGNRTDGFLKDSAKVVTRVPVNMALALLATIETVVKAILTVVSNILLPFTEAPFNYFKDATGLAGRATKEALKGILGFATAKPDISVTKEIIEADVVTVDQPTSVVEEEESEEEEIVEERSYVQKGQDFVNSLSTKQKIAGAVVIALAFYVSTGPTLRALGAFGNGLINTGKTLGCGVTQNSGNLANKATLGFLGNNTVTNWAASTRIAERLTNLCA